MKDYNIEVFYNLLRDNKFDELLELESIFRAKIKDDAMVKNIFDNYLISSVLIYITNLNDEIYSHIILKKIYFRFIHHRNKTYSIPDLDFEKLVSKYIQILQNINKQKSAYTISLNWPKLEIASKFINEYEKSNPKEINHSNSLNIKVSQNTNIKTKNSTIPLFKSTQEYEFFYSISDYYPNYFTYPNVALSCIVNFDDIKNELNQNESNYFFKAIIDCVVFKTDNNNFIPMYFFELDSIFHDNEEQIIKDKIKDKILSLAGQSLYRVRAKDNSNLKRNDFKQLIEEVLINRK